MSNDVVSWEYQKQLATSIVKSGLFGIKDESQALALMAVAASEGLHPAKACQTYHIIQGKPAIKADALLARFQEAGGKVAWVEYTDEKVVGTFTHQQGGSITVDWTIERAKKIGLANKDNWKNYPRNMLRARCVAEGVRAVFPGIATGIYTVEEVTDMPQAPAKNMGTVEVVDIDKARRLEIENQFASCKTLNELSDVWVSLSGEERHALKEKKDEIKEIIINVEKMKQEEESNA